MTMPMVYVVHGWEAENIDNILKQVKKKSSDNERQDDFICVGSSCPPAADSVVSLTAYLINHYRIHGGPKVGRITILSPEDEMLGLQLCLADINLQNTGEFDAPISDVLTEMNHVAQMKLENADKEKVLQPELGITDGLAKEQKKVFEKYQEFLKSSFYVDLYDLLNFYKNQCSLQNEDVKCLNDKSFIFFDTPVNAIEKAMFSFLCSTREVTKVVVKESALDDEEDVNLEFHSVACSADLLESHSHPKTPKANHSLLSPKNTKTPRDNHSILSPKFPKTPKSNLSTLSPKNTKTPKTYHSTLSPKNTKTPKTYHSTLSPKNTKTPKTNPSTLSPKNTKTPKANHSILSPKFPKTPKANQLKLSPTQKYIQQVFLAYIDLLVNSNSSISLARVINIPDREIDHKAFTLLKRKANKSNLSMYQFAISLVMNIRLGGKGYAPDQDDPLMMYVNGLSQFVNLLQNLHSIAEDEKDNRLACQKVVKLLKKTILKSKESLSRKPAVEEMAEKIQEDIKAAYTRIESRLQNSSSQPVKKRVQSYESKTLQVLQAVLDQHVINTTGASDTSVLSDVFLTQGTPLRFPSLLSQFRSPEPDACVEKIQPLSERLSRQIINKQVVPRSKSFLSWVAPSINEHIPVVGVDCVLPSKTLVCPASGKKIYTDFSKNEKENIPNEYLSQNDCTESKENKETDSQDKAKEIKEKGAKRKRAEKKSVAPKKKCCKKLLPQIKGQTTLNFFLRK